MAFGMAVVVVPLSVPAALKVCRPASAVKVLALFVRLPPKVKVSKTVLVPPFVSSQTVPLLSVTLPLNAIARTVVEVEPKSIVPLIDVDPFTVNGRSITSVAPLLIVSPAQV